MKYRFKLKNVGKTTRPFRYDLNHIPYEYSDKWIHGGKDRRQEEKGTTEDEMVEWHHQFDGHEFKQAPGVGDGQGSLVCYSPWGHKELRHD